MSANDSLLEVYLYENIQLLERLEALLLAGEKQKAFNAEQIDEIFRILHTIKGSSSMMGFDNIAKLAHAMEDLLSHLREHKSKKSDHRKICDLIFSAGDFIKIEINKIQATGSCDGNASELIVAIKAYYDELQSGNVKQEEKAPKAKPEEAKQEESPAAENTPGKKYKAVVHFQKDCKMENVRAFGIIKSIEELCQSIKTIPEDVLVEHSDEEIASNGFTIFMESNTDSSVLKQKISEAFFITSLEFSEVEDAGEKNDIHKESEKKQTENIAQQAMAVDTLNAQKQNYMSVRLEKLDKLMDLVGEIVITESTVTKNPHVLNLHIDSFDKAARQLRKLTDELQDIVMSIRMIPVSATFHKMERIVRDMSVKTDKKADLIIIGEDTELDKNVIDNLSDPLMHIIRNAMDHGIEPASERESKGKNPVGRIVLEAKNTGGEVIIVISDDGRGLDREKLIKKGIEKGLIKKPEAEITDKEAYNLIFNAGFSTKEQVTEFSGRGVGMDVALKNIEKMGGSLSVDSELGKGMTVQMRIPLTLAIIDGMQVGVGETVYIIPLLAIKESFKPKKDDVFSDPDGNEMIMIRGNCYSVLRLHELLGMHTDITNFEDGILVMVEAEARTFCLFVDCLIGEQQTVIKPMPLYISRSIGWIKSIAGCTILGDGSISLILDINGLLKTA